MNYELVYSHNSGIWLSHTFNQTTQNVVVEFCSFSCSGKSVSVIYLCGNV